MAERILNTRIQQKHDTEANWLKIANFKPKAGEIIIYDVDINYSYPRIKVGNGIDNISELKFLGEKADIITKEEIDAICGGYIENPSITPSKILLRSENKVFNLTIDDDGTLMVSENQEV